MFDRLIGGCPTCGRRSCTNMQCLYENGPKLTISEMFKTAIKRSSEIAKVIVDNQTKLIVPKEKPMSNKQYIIAKNASSTHWEYYYDSDPQEGLHISHSAAHTHSGKQVNLPESFSSQEEAQPYLDKIKEFNPSVGYAICPVIKESF